MVQLDFKKGIRLKFRGLGTAYFNFKFKNPLLNSRFPSKWLINMNNINRVKILSSKYSQLNLAFELTVFTVSADRMAINITDAMLSY
jgi:hypothetical protein